MEATRTERADEGGIRTGLTRPHPTVEKRNADENVRVNGVSDSVEVIEGDATVILPLLAPVRVVLANIISSVLTAMLPAIKSALGADGQAILSGLLAEERPTMLAALESGDWCVQREDTEDAWWSVQIASR